MNYIFRLHYYLNWFNFLQNKKNNYKSKYSKLDILKTNMIKNKILIIIIIRYF